MPLPRRVAPLALVALLGSARAAADCPAPASVAVDGLGPAADFLRVAELAGAAPPPSLIQRAGARTATLCDPGRVPLPAFVHADPGGALRVVPFTLTTTWNSAYPSGEDDGLLWAGRGVSQHLGGGVALRLGPLSAALAPEVTWSENRWFDTVPTARAGDLRFGNAFYPDQIDLPQRFGAGPLAAWGPGQSYLRLDHANVALGISTENLWLGPGLRNAIVLSNAGPGFPHVFLGTSRPADVWLGDAELLLFWGRLERSRYVAHPTHPLVNGLTVTFQPRGLPTLTLGFTRMFTQVWKDLRLRNWLSVFQALDKQGLQGAYGTGGENPDDNQITSLFGRWSFPDAGFEFYGEWAREDYTWSWWSELRQPDRGQAFTIGFQKTFRAGRRLGRFYAEITSLQEMAGFGTKEGAVVYYVHGADLSLTNRGQLLGAFVGPGGSSQTIGVDLFDAGGRIGAYVGRIRRNDEYYWRVVEPGVLFGEDTELTAGLRQVLATRLAEVSWDAAASYRWNRDFLRNEANFRLVLAVTLPAGRPAPPAP